MRMYDVIYKKREGGKLTRSEIDYAIKGYTSGEIPDYQLAALLMAVFFKGMDFEETLGLTEAMVSSGEKYDLSGFDLPTCDKHSTGGVGDKISIPLVPIITSFDVIVPMMSGRGLGHTGGTLDKLESIPGFNVNIGKKDFLRLLKKNRTAMIGQTEKIAPADKKLYALRDVTATVESIGLITASIMSKKLAEGAQHFIFDVKFGSGAFMKTRALAEKLACSLTKVTGIAGRKAAHVLSDMNTPLGNMIGNRLEIVESIDILKGGGPEDSRNLTELLAAKMLVITGIFRTEQEALKEIRKRYSTGVYLERFAKIIEMQAGDPRVIENVGLMKPARNIKEFKASRRGLIKRMDAFEFGISALMLGAGRNRKEDHIDHSAGIELIKKEGDKVAKNEVIALLHYNNENLLAGALQRLRAGLCIE